MARRPTTYTKQCNHEGCREVGRWSFNSRREYSEWFKRKGKAKWLCVRHTRPNEVLSFENRIRIIDLVNEKSKRYPNLKDLFWSKPSNSGFCHGPGFKAYSEDFPEGTILRIKVEIILPDTQNQ